MRQVILHVLEIVFLILFWKHNTKSNERMNEQKALISDVNVSNHHYYLNEGGGN